MRLLTAFLRAMALASALSTAAASAASGYSDEGNTLAMEGKFDEADAAFMNALAIEPDNADIITNYGDRAPR